MTENKKDWRHALYQIGAVLLIVGAISPIFVGALPAAAWAFWGNILYLLGAALFLAAFITAPIKSLSTRQRRYYRMNVLTGSFFLISALLRLWRTDTLWMAFMGIALGYMIYGMVLLLTSKKEKNEE